MDVVKAIKEAPIGPGIYLFKSKKGRLLYVGKAANLRARLRSYQKPGWKDDMLKEASNIAWEELDSDVGALIREAEIIKKEKPYYNILMRDDKNYFFVAFTKEAYPRIYLTHQPTGEKKITSIGPFTDGESIKRVLRLLRRVFPYCTCPSERRFSRAGPSSIRHKRKCVNAEIGKCLGYCCANVPSTKKQIAEYKSNIQSIKKVLGGKTKTLERELLKKMEKFSREQKYEEARMVRDQIASLERIFKHSPHLKNDIGEEHSRALEILKDILKLKTVPTRIEGYDISHHQGDTQVASMVVFENGIPKKSDYRKFIMRTGKDINDPARMQEVLSRRLNHPEWPYPDIILVDGGKGQLNAAAAVLEDREDRNFFAVSEPPQRGGLSGKKLRSPRTENQKHPKLCSIAKREEELYIEGVKLPLKLKTLPPPLLNLITHIRDESHRFAISFHRKRRRRLVIPR